MEWFGYIKLVTTVVNSNSVECFHYIKLETIVMNTNTAQWFNYIRLRRLLSHLYCAAVIIIQGLHIIMWFDSINPGSTVTLTVNFLLSTPLRV